MVEIRFHVEQDENGVFSGLDLAREVIADAYRLLTAYVDGCPACADDLFTVLANQEMLALHGQRDGTGEVPTLFLAAGSEEGKEQAVRQHVQAARAEVDALLNEQREEWGWSSSHAHREHQQGQSK